MNVSTLTGLLAQVPPIQAPSAVFSPPVRPDEPATVQQLLAAGPELEPAFDFIVEMGKGKKTAHVAQHLLGQSPRPSTHIALDEQLALQSVPPCPKEKLFSWRLVGLNTYPVWQLWQIVKLCNEYLPEYFKGHSQTTPLTGDDFLRFMSDLGSHFEAEGWLRGGHLEIVLWELQMEELGYDDTDGWVCLPPSQWDTPKKIILSLGEQPPLDMGWFIQTHGLDFDMNWESLTLIDKLALTMLLSDDPETGNTSLVGIYGGCVPDLYHSKVIQLYDDLTGLPTFGQFSQAFVERNLEHAPPLIKDGVAAALSLWTQNTGNLFVDVSAHQTLERGYTHSGWEWCLPDVAYLRQAWQDACDDVFTPVEKLNDWLTDSLFHQKAFFDWCLGLNA